MEDIPKKKRKQLSNSMQHLQPYVTVPLEENAYGVPADLQPLRKPRTESAENMQKRSDPFQFGTRYLEEGDDIFAYNAWDHVEVDDDYKKFAEEQYARQRESPVEAFDKTRFNDHPERWWNRFYSNNKVNFFKDRKWLQQEFPILSAVTQPDSPPTVLLEVGAGAGNTAFPILKHNKNPNLEIHACDFSKKAVELIQSSEAYSSSNNTGSIRASVWDVASPPLPGRETPTLPEGLSPRSVDVVVLIFIFSALAPSQWQQALNNIWHLLKPGGVVLFRDYGKGDLAQVRFKKGRYLEENFYVRGDGTRVYFFEETELRRLWSAEEGRDDAATDITNGVADIKLDSDNNITTARRSFEILDFGVDRRMLVNRQRRIKMYRCWLQAIFRKPSTADPRQAGNKEAHAVPSALELLSRDTAELSNREPESDAVEANSQPIKKNDAG